MKKRDVSFDIIKTFAAFSVVAVHFFLNSGFYSTPVSGKRMYLEVVMRTFFMVCVPLFLLATGGLMNRKTLSKKYYAGLLPLLFTYLASSAACLVFRVCALKETITFAGAIRRILDFSAAPYGWYVEMYLGLFLIIPFLNLAFDALGTKKKQFVLCATMCVLCALPTFLNIRYKLMPDWFAEGAYPIMYYYIGAFITRNGIRFRKGINNFLLLAAAVVLFGVFNIVMRHGTEFGWAPFTLWHSVSTVVLSVLLFMLLLRTKDLKLPPFASKVLAALSSVTLGTYLLSYIFDQIAYPILNGAVAPAQMRVVWFLPVTLSVYVLSACSALVIELVRRGIFGLFGKKKTDV